MRNLARALALTAALVSSTGAWAGFNLSPSIGGYAQSGTSFYKSSGLVWGGELTYQESTFEAGFYYQKFVLKPDITSGTMYEDSSINFGGEVRIPWSGSMFFSDLRIGSTRNDSGFGNGSDAALGFGAGVGYTFPVHANVMIRPRFGATFAPISVGGNSTGRAFYDLSLMVTITNDSIYPSSN